MRFEIMFIIKPDLTDREVNNKLFDVRSYISGNGGKVIKEDLWKKKNCSFSMPTL